MIPLTALWLPILASAVLVFIVSALIHMLLPYHRTDYGPVAAETQVMDDLRRANLTPGDYVVPYAASPKEMAEPAYAEKLQKGPVAFITVIPNGPPTMGRSLALWFLYALIASVIAGYVASRALGAAADYLDVFRFAGAAAFAAYVPGIWQQSIWYGRSWSSTLKSSFDGVVYALLTAGVFGWLWPGV